MVRPNLFFAFYLLFSLPVPNLSVKATDLVEVTNFRGSQAL